MPLHTKQGKGGQSSSDRAQAHGAYASCLPPARSPGACGLVPHAYALPKERKEAKAGGRRMRHTPRVYYLLGVPACA